MWFMNENDMNLDIFVLKWIQAKIVSLRAADAVNLLLRGTIQWVINGDDILTETFLAQGKRLRREDGEIIWFDTYVPSATDPYLPQGESVKDMNQWISRLFLMDTISPMRLKVLTRTTKNPSQDLESIARRGDILTSYPYLVRMLLAQKFSWSKVGRIQKTEGKIEAQLALGIWASGIDIVDTGASAKKNNLAIGETIFESVPVWIFSDRALTENKRLRTVTDILVAASNNAYYNSSDYRERFPRG